MAPVYEYVCPDCGRFDKLSRFSDASKETIPCKDCGKESTKVPSVSSFELKGGGWFGSGYTKGE